MLFQKCLEFLKEILIWFSPPQKNWSIQYIWDKITRNILVNELIL